MNCPECSGDSFESGRFEIAQSMDGRPRILENVTARRCVQCGYLIVSGSVLKEIERRVMLGAYSRLSPVEVYDLSVPLRTRLSRNGIAATTPIGTVFATSAHPEIDYEQSAIA